MRATPTPRGDQEVERIDAHGAEGVHLVGRAHGGQVGRGRGGPAAREGETGGQRGQLAHDHDGDQVGSHEDGAQLVELLRAEQ
jgi:hypothetical protein